MRSQCQIVASGKQKAKYRPILLCLWLAAILQLIYSNTNQQAPRNGGLSGQQATVLGNDAAAVASNQLNSAALNGGFILMAEAGKKKKEKSEVVVISVQNSPPKGGGMYPIFIPSCGGHGGGHGGGYGRRKRRSVVTYVS